MGSVGRKPIPLDERRQFVSVGLAPSIMAALKTFQRRSGISNSMPSGANTGADLSRQSSPYLAN
jgi:hypothetical protein